MRPVTKISVFGIRLGIVVLGAYWIALFTGTHLPDTLDFSPAVHDKTKHFSAFFGLATLLCYVTNSQHLVRRFGTIALVCMAYGAMDELTQGFVAGRCPDFYDFIADTLGVSLAITCYVGIKLIAFPDPRVQWRTSRLFR